MDVVGRLAAPRLAGGGRGVGAEPWLAASAASGWVSIDRSTASDWTGWLASEAVTRASSSLG
jgi:hypothetical protein